MSISLPAASPWSAPAPAIRACSPARLGPAATGRGGGLRPPGRPRADRPSAGKLPAHLRRQALRPPQPAAGRNQRAAGAPGPAATPGGPPERRRPVHLRSRRRGAGAPARSRRRLPGGPRRHRRLRLQYLRRHPADPPRPRPVLHLRHRPPAERRPPRPRLGRPGAWQADPGVLHGPGNLAEIAARLVEHGLASDTPAALVSQAPRRASR